MITFNAILRAETIDPNTVLLVRHHDGRAKSGDRTPYSLWRTDPEGLELYQRIQSRDLFPIGSRLASFVATPSGETLFTGLYLVVDRGVVPRGTIDPVSAENVDGLLLYTLDRDERLDAYSGLLFVDWGLGFRSWVQKAQRQDKPIVELRRRVPSPDFGAIAPFAEKFGAPGFIFGEWGGGPNADGEYQMPFFDMSDEVQAFLEAAYEGHWVLDADFTWFEWKGGKEARRLFDEPGQIEKATVRQLAQMLTVVIRADRFSEGALDSAFESGLLPRILRRASVLAAARQAGGSRHRDDPSGGSDTWTPPPPIEGDNTRPTEITIPPSQNTTLPEGNLVGRDADPVALPSPASASDTLEAEAICRKIYEETRSRYAELAPGLGSAALGFRILYGPPVVRAPYMFIGFQPGGWKDESYEGQHDSWPDQSWHANAKAPLAKKLQHVFAIQSVEHTGLNMIFFRAPTMEAWHSVPPGLRRELEKFSFERVQRIIAVLRPQHLVVIGLATFKQLTKTKGQTALLGQKGNRLAVEGEFGGYRASGIVHLTGVHVSKHDLERLKAFFNQPIST
ncbi:hypothetical protein QO002_005907 [Pararhizobium capsulatum DSM 1112]|uniref:Uracil-DNA glycosylase-like domain-containing protein n=1 Tax=Pararhizobium capsulatum DSM 1112 TaxID=1121113 RepID=A0ABU0BZL4_9HYPH|nr:DUF6508 domain-containing protein [Pararhizobium capsulatum]MDQ0323700.1 hypothetical protein [Pararhizobium capsulatum DSM 1112]